MDREKIKEIKALFHLQVSKIDNLLIMNKEESHEVPSIRNEGRSMSVDITDIERVKEE